jgi:hypothetical protein
LNNVLLPKLPKKKLKIHLSKKGVIFRHF